jgi:3-oxoacyl-[acyl-carrier protein] reductase
MENRVILIIGATSMIGRACAKILDRDGNILILLGRDKEKLSSLTKGIKGAWDSYVMDVTSENDVNNTIKKVLKKYERVDALVYNVAMYPWKKIEDLSAQAYQSTLTTNLVGAFLVTKACIPFMKKQRKGKIVYISSLAGETIGVPFMAAYTSSKAGLNGLMRTAALELAPFDISVNAISPGKVWDPATLSEEERAQKLRSIPLGRFIDPKDISTMVEFLLSEKANNITGQNFIVDGGQSILGKESHLNDPRTLLEL